MKFLHISDLHLGRTLGGFDLTEDQKYMLDKIIELAVQEKADALLIAGDIYDKRTPSDSAVSLFDSFLTALCDSGIETFIIAGNHDSPEKLAFGSTIFDRSGIHISTGFGGRLARYTLSDEYGELDVFLMPFIRASQVRHFFPEKEKEITDYESAVRCVIENEDISADRRNIILAHQFVTGSGSSDPVTGGSESVSVLNVGLVERISFRCFDAFDYAALGHIHSPQRVGRSSVRYSGSMLKYSKSEADTEKSVTVVTVGGKGNVMTDTVTIPPRRDLRHIRGKIDDLTDRSRLSDTQDFIFATLTDSEDVENAIDRLRECYPNIIGLDYDREKKPAAQLGGTVAARKGSSFEDIIRDFYTFMTDGEEISERELEIMKELAKEAGIINETDHA